MKSPDALRFITVVSMLLIGALAGCTLISQPGSEETPVPSETPTPIEDVPPTPPPWAPLADSTCSDGRKVHVAYAVDGDTLALTNANANGEQERVRLIGIDTPEVYPEDEVECYGPEASAYSHAMVDDTDVCLTYDPAVALEDDNVDMYGRTLAYVFYGEGYVHFLNADLVANGYAYDFPYTDGAAFESYFAALEAWAREQDLGLWGTCY